jgi:hypothetical protein
MNGHRYDDIINLPHHQSEKRAHMSLIDRAAQFSPFAALTGYDDCIKETARITERRKELDDDEKAVIGEKLTLLQSQLAENPRKPILGVTITYFVPDKTKDGGSYVTLTGAVKKIDDCEHTICMADGVRISIEDVLTIRFSCALTHEVELFRC